MNPQWTFGHAGILSWGCRDSSASPAWEATAASPKKTWCFRALEPTLNYSGIPRHADRQQIEFCILALIRVSRLLSALLPKRVHDARLIGRNLAMRSEH